MKRSLSLLCVLALSLSLASGCAPKQEAPASLASESEAAQEASPASSEAPSGEGKSIVFAGFPGQEKTFDEIAAAFKEQSGVEVKVNILPRTGYREALIGPLSSGSSEFDAIYIQNPWLAEFAEAGFLEPMDAYLTKEQKQEIKDDQFPDIYSAGIYQDKLWGLPWDLSTFFLFYRTDLIDTPPQTMEEYLELAKQFTKELNPDSPTNFGTVLEGSTERVNYQEWYSFLWSFGGDLFDENGNPTLNSPEAVASLEFRYGMKNEHGVVPPDVDNYKYPEVLSAFQEGIAPMVLQWNAAYATFADAEASPKIYDKFAAVPMPAFVAEDGTRRSVPFAKAWYLSVSSFSQKKQEAADFIRFFTGYEGSMISLRNGASPGSVKAWNEPEVKEMRPDVDLFKESMGMARMTPNLPELPSIENELGQALSHVLAGSKSAQQALDEVNEAAVKVLQQSGRLS
ncbi:sugar ABC transporter substrate-binding protein [Harryflintia acetispora]|uniref:sugar ABC transporter substrate-binding protein n=1 Tax=Harryflintia acetispora TaxID=1849041 RepID=UPI001896A7B4|nr:sugar ABC transporter substrate-binding protein [Harryflintia acetispora]